MAARMLLLPRLARLGMLQRCCRAPLPRHVISLRSGHAPHTYSTVLAPGAHAARPATPAAALAQSSQQTQPADHFAAQTSADFEALGISTEVAKALRSAGFPAPARVQELAIPTILGGKDVVLAAETGSGKTLAYIAPVATMLLRSAAGLSDEERKHRKQIALVLCPNAALCQQVVASAASLQGPDGKPLLLACHVSSANPPPFDTPDIVVTTPGALMTLLYEAGPHYGRLWTEEGLALRVGHVVVDEADLLVSGGYVKDLTRLLDLLKAGERRRIEAQVMRELGMHQEGFQRLPRPIKVACWEGGVPAMLAAGWRPSSAVPAADDAGAAASAGETSKAVEEAARNAGGEASSSGRQQPPQQPQYGPYLRRQYIFVAATMPSVTKADAATELQRRYKDAAWVSGDLLHKSKPNVSHKWLQVEDSTWAKALVGVLLEDPEYQEGRARVLVFAKDTSSAEEVSAVLRREAIQHVVYHKNVPQEERAAALQAMAGPSTSTASDGRAPTAASNAIMVSTDAAARGIDLPGVTHVIQADFAMTAVDFLHRIGRTARAGRAGKVTSLYNEASSDLAGVLREYVEAGRPVEDAFSRKRSFSRKMKRYGKFVPRGAGEGYDKPTLEQRLERRRLMHDAAAEQGDGAEEYAAAQSSGDDEPWEEQPSRHGRGSRDARDGRASTNSRASREQLSYSSAREESKHSSSREWLPRSALGQERDENVSSPSGSSDRFSREWSPRNAQGTRSNTQPRQWDERDDRSTSSSSREWAPDRGGRGSRQWEAEQSSSSGRGSRQWSPDSPDSRGREAASWGQDGRDNRREQSPRGRAVRSRRHEDDDGASSSGTGTDDRRWQDKRGDREGRWEGGGERSGGSRGRSAGRHWEDRGGRQDRGRGGGRSGGRDNRDQQDWGGRQESGGGQSRGEQWQGRGGRAARQERFGGDEQQRDGSWEGGGRGGGRGGYRGQQSGRGRGW